MAAFADCGRRLHQRRQVRDTGERQGLGLAELTAGARHGEDVAHAYDGPASTRFSRASAG